MGTYRLYPDKSNTLIEDANINTGLNEVMELWYGLYGITRHLVHFNFTEYLNQYALGYVPHITAATSTFNMGNCYPVYETSPYDAAQPATDVDIEVKVLAQAFSQGRGYDFYGTKKVNGISNWYSASSVSGWSLPGGDFAYTVFSGHIDKGNSDIVGIVTDEVELWNSFTGDNYGFAVKFTDEYEALSSSTKSVLKYYTENVNTRYRKPYIEFTWDDQVRDQIDEIDWGTTKRLYFYARNITGAYASVSAVSSCTITYDSTAYTQASYTGSSIIQQFPGIYYIEYAAPAYASPGSAGTRFNVAWNVKIANGLFNTFNDVGYISAATGSWSTGSTSAATQYYIQTQHQSVYKQGTRFQLPIHARVQYTRELVKLRDLEYKIVLRDGPNEFTMVNWSPVSYSRTGNFVNVDTTWLHTGYTYHMTFRCARSGLMYIIEQQDVAFKVTA